MQVIKNNYQKSFDVETECCHSILRVHFSEIQSSYGCSNFSRWELKQSCPCCVLYHPLVKIFNEKEIYWL